ncbi:putative RNA-directed DNA polymerase [Helianthus anomalus]
MLLLSTISEASFQHVQGTSSRDLWISLADAYAPHTSSREYILKTQLLKIQMKGDETSSAYLTRAREYASALANIGEPMKEKDIVMLVISGLRDEYNGLKSNLLGRQYPTAFSELPGLLADQDYMIQKAVPTVPPVQAFTTATNSAPTATVLSQTLQQLIAQLNLQPQPAAPHAFYTNRGRGRGQGNRCGQGNRRGRGNFNRPRGSGNRSQFSWASNQNIVYGSCNRCGIGHIPSQCPNRDPATLRGRQPSANFSNNRSQAPSSWLPEIKQKLLSVQKFCHDNNVFFEFHSTFFVVKDKLTRLTLLTGPSKDGLYSFCLPQTQPVPKVSFSTARASSTIWHQCLGHPHPQLLQSMLNKYCLPLSNNRACSFCDSCPIGKYSKLHLLSSTFKSSNILDLVFCDVWGPAPVTSFDGHHYFLLCVDHFTKFMWIFPLKQNSDVYDTFKRFLAMVERQFKTKLKSVQTD